jgi:hypothetical protein
MVVLSVSNVSNVSNKSLREELQSIRCSRRLLSLNLSIILFTTSTFQSLSPDFLDAEGSPACRLHRFLVGVASPCILRGRKRGPEEQNFRI